MTRISVTGSRQDEWRGDYPQRPVLAVGAVVVREGAVLLVQRGKPPARGTWAIPGGRVRLGESLAEAAEREVMEETGLRVLAGEVVYSFEVIERDKTGMVLFHYYIVDLDATYVAGELSPGDDAADARWVRGPDLETLQVNTRTRNLLRERYGFV